MEVREFLKQEEEREITEHKFWAEQYWKLSQAFPERVIRKVVDGILDKRVSFAAKKLEDMYEEYYLSSQKGESYDQRIKKIDLECVKWLEEYIKETQQKKASYEVVPLHKWLKFGDYEWVKKWGITKFIDFHLDLAICQK